MSESPTAWGAIPVEDTKPPAKDSPQAWGAIPLTKTTNAGADAAEEKQLADNIASYQEEKKQRDSAKGIARYFLPPATGMAPGVGSPGRQEPIQVPRVSTDEVASAFGISPDNAASLAGFMNSVSSPFVEFPFTPQGAGVAGASAIPGVAPLVGAGFTIKAFIDNPEMAREAGAGWVEAHNPQSTPEQKQVGWEKFWGAVGNIGIGGMGAIPGAHATAKKMGAVPSPTADLINAAKPVLPNAAKEAEAIPSEKGQPNAQAIRSDQGPAQEPGVQPEVSKTDSGGDLQQAPPGTPDATAQAQVKLTPEEQAKVSSELDQELGHQPTSQPPPETQIKQPATPEPTQTAAETSIPLEGTKFSLHAKALISPDLEGKGWRLTVFNEFEGETIPAAHEVLPTRAAAIARARELEYKVPETLTTKPISAGKEGETKTAQADQASLDLLGSKHDLTLQQSQMVLEAFKTLPEGANAEALQKAYLKIALPADIPEEVGLGKVAGIKGAREVLKDLREASAGPKALPVGESPITRSGPPTGKTEKGALETGTPSERLTEIDQRLSEIDSQLKDINKGFVVGETAKRMRAPLKDEQTRLLVEKQLLQKSPISEGPGAASPGDVPSVQLDQLAQTFKSMPTTRTWADALKGSYDLGKIKSAAVDTVSRAVSGLKATGDLAKRLWENIGDLDEFKKILGKYSREVNVKDYSLRQFAGEVARTMPKVADQEAIASWVDAGGDMATLKRGALETTDRYRKSYEDAQNLTPEQLVVAKNIQNYFEARLKEAMDAGILDSGIEDYIHRIYEKGPLKDRVLNAIQSGVLDTRDPSLARKRLFEFDFEAEKAGLPIIKAFLPRILDYEASLAHAIASRAAVKRFTELKEADGNPMIAVAGLGRVVEDQAGVKPPSVIVNPHVLNEKQRGLYEHRDYPALQKWKWVTKDTDGKNVFVQGDVLIHKDSVGRIDKFLKPSAIRQNPVGRAALAASSAVKQTMLDLSGFHQVQLTVHALEHRVLPNRIVEKIDLNNPDVQKLLDGGVTLGGKYRGGIADEGLWGKSLTRMIPGLGKLSESYHEYLFNDYIPRLKMTMAMDALERNRAKYGKKLSEEKLAYLTANEANAAFGELNYTMMERSKTWQDAARLILLAPDFLEARGKFVGQALTKYGSEQRMALLLGATFMYVTARIFNKLVDGQYHFEKENLFNLVYKNHAYSLRTVQGDVLHLADKPISFWMNRLNPVYGRTALEMASGRDQFGRKRDFFDQVKDAVNTAVPISLRHNREQSILDSILISLGVTARKYSDVGNAYKLANDWRKKAGVKERPEVIYDPDKDDLYGLKVDLWNDDQAGAVKEIKRLIESGKSSPRKLKDHFNAYASSPFTGSRANDAKFLASLGKDDKITVESAKTHKRLVREQFNKALEIYVSLKDQEPPKESKP